MKQGITMKNVYYKRIIEGHTVPAIIHNFNYFYLDMAVYEDGSVSCWDRVEIDKLPHELERGWLTTQIPIGEHLSIHGLGSYKIVQAEWKHTSESFVQNVYDILRQMNPEKEGLYKETSVQRQRWDQRKVHFMADPIPYKFEYNFGYTMMNGVSTHLFHKKSSDWQLATLTAYPDKTITVDSQPDQWLSIDDVNQMFEAGILKSNLEDGSKIIIEDFGVITFSGPHYSPEDKDKRLEIADMVSEVSGEETSLERCRSIYEEYLEEPTEENRMSLKQAYEAVPEHQRMYLGDMDSKDGDYVRIIYGIED
jgi:hypothetical protein